MVAPIRADTFAGGKGEGHFDEASSVCRIRRTFALGVHSTAGSANVVLEEIQVPRIKPMSRMAFHRANQREQWDAHERKEKGSWVQT